MKMEGDLISIIVPVYNVENYLRECVDSILAQTYSNIEVILIDDGSKDNSGKICDEYAEKDKRVEVIHKENGGLSEARNTGLNRAKGEWIAFVDSDDFIDNSMLDTLINLAKANNAQLALCTFRPTTEQIKEGQNKKIQVFDRDELIYCYVNRVKDYCITNSVWDRLYKSELVKQVRFMPDRLNEDILYTMEVFLKVNKAIYTSEKFYQYRDIREGNISEKKVSLKSINDKNYLTNLAAEILRKDGYEELADIYESMNFLEVAELLADKENNYNKELSEYRKYIKDILKKVIFNSNLRMKAKIRIGMAYMFPGLEKNMLKAYGKIIKRKQNDE